MFRIRRVLSYRVLASCTRNAFSSSEARSLPHSHSPILPPPSFLGVGISENHGSISFAKLMSSRASSEQGKGTEKTKKEITNVENPFDDSPTYNIPEKPVTFVEGASYSVIILAGLGVAAAAGYAVFKELIFQPKEYKIYNKALKRIQDDGQVRVRIGSPITGYGQESRNRAARQRIPNRVWTDEEGVEHVEVNFFIRAPHGHGKVFAEMFKGVDGEWKFTYLIVEIRAPSPAQLILESYIPSYNTNK
ncbi:probable mitochondrial import inner membrane translocase subunit TIM21 [Vicia villosa]|uniref:probable mitochondrial import inner membrane translocase subunit TIM21 n=1 Tax=Vicia villosa TaxID=3911 RepID=UPI00273ABFD8|nr:probable mitochondrial import inner membrane translocase subunit TIM21 [Vicia villosa]